PSASMEPPRSATKAGGGSTQLVTEQLIPGIPKAGSIAAATAPGHCILSETQYTVQYSGGPAKLVLEFHPDNAVSLAMRRSLPVTIEGDKVVADIGPAPRGRIALPDNPPFDGATYFVAVYNCAPRATNFT